MTRWMPVSAKSLTNMYGLSTEIALSENYHFYRPDEVEIDNFRLIAFIQPADRNDYLTFRFWSLNDEHEPLHNHNVLLPEMGGFLSFKNYEIEELIQLLKKHGDLLEDANPKGRSFQVIPEEEYKDYFIRTYFQGENKLSLEAIRSMSDVDILLTLGFEPSEDHFYLCVADVEDVEPNDDKLLKLSFGRKEMSMKVFRLPQNIKSYEEFRTISAYSRGGLNLTKRGVDELCQMLNRNA